MGMFLSDSCAAQYAIVGVIDLDSLCFLSPEKVVSKQLPPEGASFVGGP